MSAQQKGVEFIDGRRVVRSKNGTILEAYNGANESPIPTKIYCGTWCGIKLYTHLWLVILFIAVISIECAVNFYDGKMLGFTIIWCLALWLSVLLHCIAQVWTSKKFGGIPTEIILWPFGNLTYQCPSKDPGSDLLIALSGPAVHVVFVVAFGLSSISYETHDHLIYNDLSIDVDFGHYTLVELFAMQISLFIFNLIIPAFPLCGGRALLDMMIIKKVPIMKAAKACFWLVNLLMAAWSGFLIYAWVEYGGGQSRIFSLCTLVWILLQNFSLWFAMKSEEALLQNPMFAPYKSWQTRMGDMVTQAEVAEQQAAAFADANAADGGESGALPAINIATHTGADTDAMPSTGAEMAAIPDPFASDDNPFASPPEAAAAAAQPSDALSMDSAAPDMWGTA